MRKQRSLRRFTGGQVLLHWINAGPYLVLMGTGLLLVLARTLAIEPIPIDLLQRMHRITGAALVILLVQAAVVGLFAPSFRSLYQSLGQALHWRGHDLLWLIKVPLNLVNKRITLPPADRFNAGQKLHLLAVTSALIGLSITGLLMWFWPGRIVPWIVHVAFFLLAAGFLTLHLFLSLINPETRRSLPTIFTGWVDPAYARAHHARWLGVEPEPDTHHYVSPIAVGVTGLLVLSLLFGAGLAYGPQRLQARTRELIAQYGAPIVMPDLLSHAHGTDPNCAACTACHTRGGLPTDDACRECHAVVAERLDQGRGFHGTLTGPCRDCHAEHYGTDANLIDLEAAAFHHDRAAFALEGAHRRCACAACHAEDVNRPETLHFIGIAYETCRTCHQDPHRNPEDNHCRRCHGMDNWGPDSLTFDHDRDSDFPLEGAHRQAVCADCHNRDHTPDTFILRNIGKTCQDCHTDPHEETLGATCIRCHQEQGWTGEHLRFDHDRDSDFPLDSLHRCLACTDCHTRSDHHYTAAGTTCETCHVFQTQALAGTLTEISFPADPHYQRVTCKDCHDTTQARPSTASYAERCVDCHTAAYGNLFYQWQQQLHRQGSGLPRKVGFHNLSLQQQSLSPEAN